MVSSIVIMDDIIGISQMKEIVCIADTSNTYDHVKLNVWVDTINNGGFQLQDHLIPFLERMKQAVF